MPKALPRDVSLLIKKYCVEFQECRARKYWGRLIYPKVTIMMKMKDIGKDVKRTIPSTLKEYLGDIRLYNNNRYDYFGSDLFKYTSYSNFILNLLPRQNNIILTSKEVFIRDINQDED